MQASPITQFIGRLLRLPLQLGRRLRPSTRAARTGSETGFQDPPTRGRYPFLNPYLLDVGLRDVTSLVEQIIAVKEDDTKLLALFQSLQSYKDRCTFTRFFSDEHLVRMGLAEDVLDLVQRFPNR